MSIETVFFYEPDIEGEHEFADGVIVDVSWDGAQGEGSDEDGASEVPASLPGAKRCSDAAL